MQLKLSKSQSSGIMGGGKLSIVAQIIPTPEQRAIIDKFKLHKEVVTVTQSKLHAALGGVKVMTIGGLLGGETFSCKNIQEMLEVEEHMKLSAAGLKKIVDAASEFGGDVIIDL